MSTGTAITIEESPQHGPTRQRPCPTSRPLAFHRIVLIIPEENPHAERDGIEGLGPHGLAALGGEQLDVAFGRPSVDGEGLVLGVDAPIVRTSWRW